jgi:hypothetical protein
MKVYWAILPIEGKRGAESQDVPDDVEDDDFEDDDDVDKEEEGPLKFQFYKGYAEDFKNIFVSNTLIALADIDVSSAENKKFVETVEQILVTDPSDVEVKITYFNEFESKDGDVKNKTKVVPAKIHYVNNKPAINVFSEDGTDYAEIAIFFADYDKSGYLFDDLTQNGFFPLFIYPGRATFQNKTDLRLFELVLPEEK